MLEQDLIMLIHQVLARKTEMQSIELKSAKQGTPERLYDTLSAFANQHGGGIIIFGIQEKPAFEVVGVYDAGDLQTKVTNYSLQMEPIIRPVFTMTEYEGKTVVSAEIPECDIYDKPCYYKGAGRLRGSYVRVGEADLPMTEYEVYSYEAFKKNIQDELRNVPRASTQDFDEALLAEYFLKLRSTKPQLSKLENQKILELQGLTSGHEPTVAGIMLLCTYPQAFFPQLSVTAMVVAGTEIGEAGEGKARFIDNKRIDGNIPNMLEETLAFVRRNTKQATIIDENGKRADRSEYPMLAVRELILNALMHRDYSSLSENSPVRVVLYSDRLEIENPGGLYGRLTINDLGYAPADTRNPHIAGNLEILIDAENRFSGIPTVRYQMEEAKLPEPKFESHRGNFKVTLYNKTAQSEFADRNLSENDLIRFCRTPRTREEIADFLHLKSPYYAARQYIKPLVEAGKLSLTFPEAPNSKSQKYFSVTF